MLDQRLLRQYVGGAQDSLLTQSKERRGDGYGGER